MILPARKLVLLSPLQPAEAAQALRAVLAPKRDWRQKMLRQGGGAFTGDVSDSHFSIVRDIRYRNSFLPFVTGEIAAAYPGSRIEVRMKMHGATTGFMTVWLGFTFLMCVTFVAAFFKVGALHFQGDPGSAAIPFGMLLFGIGMTWGGFLPEAKKAQNFLVEVLRADVELPPDPNRAL